MAIIQTTNLTKRFKDLLAVDGVDLEVGEGECFGLLGPNGAGKTSLIRMITAVSPPTVGDIQVLGLELRTHSQQVKAVMGIMPQFDNLDPDLTVLQNLVTFARYFDIPAKEAHRRSMEVLTLFELEDRCKSRINELSGGMKRRLLLARSLINRPRIIVLDEPTVGLDPQARHLVWNKLGELKSQGVTQLLCTQNMDEAAILCDRVAVMHRGKVLVTGTPRELVSRYVGGEVWEITPGAAERDNIIGELKSRGLEFEDVGSAIQVFHVGDGGPLRELVSSPKLRCREGTLEDVFLKLTGRSLLE